MLKTKISRHPGVRLRVPPFPYRRLTWALVCGGQLLSVASMAGAQETSAPMVQAPERNAAQGKDVDGAVATPAPSAETTTQAAPAGAATLNTVVVTATRRREPAREVPMQVDVLSADKLQQSGARSMVDYLSSEPGVNLDGGGGAGQVSVRGVTTGTQTSATVGIYVDNIPFGSSTFYGGGGVFLLDMGLLDLNHIEILRGPQGTLYGAGAMGGLLKYVTNEPDTSAFYGQVGAGLSVTEHGGINNSVNTVLNIPLKTDVAAMRVSAFNIHDGGYIDATGPLASTRVNRGDTTGGRISLLLTPTGQFTARLTATTQYVNGNGSGTVDYNMNGQPVAGGLQHALYTPEGFHQSFQVYAADLEYDFGWARLNSISAYQTIGSQTAKDATSSYGALFAAAGMNFGGISLPTDITTNKYTQEFRLTSPGNRRLEWLAGLYYTRENSTYNSGVLGVNPSSDLERFTIPSLYQEYAAYGDVTYHLTPRLSFTGGLRIAHNNQDFSQTTYGTLAGPASTLSGTSSDTSKTYLLTASYKLTDNSNVYVRAANGYRPGGPNVPVIDVVSGQPVPSPLTFKPDTLWTYEAGYKADMLDNRLSVAVTVYDIRWKDMQILSAINGSAVILNAGKAEIRGLELASSFRPTPNWNFSASLSAIDARLTEAAPGSGLTAGDPLPNSAKFSAALSATYLFKAGGFPAYVGVSERIIGFRHAGFPSDTGGHPDFPLPGYAITDLQAGIDFKKASLSFYVRNLFDRRALLSAATALVPVGGPVAVTVAQPRTIGANLTIPF